MCQKRRSRPDLGCSAIGRKVLNNDDDDKDDGNDDDDD
jgi:hypothetical protein